MKKVENKLKIIAIVYMCLSLCGLMFTIFEIWIGEMNELREDFYLREKMLPDYLMAFFFVMFFILQFVSALRVFEGLKQVR